MSLQVLPIIVVACVLGYYVLRMRSMGGRAEKFAEARRVFDERTGYQPIASSSGAQLRRGETDSHMARDYMGARVHWVQKHRIAHRGYSMTCAWYVPLHASPNRTLHIADKSLRGPGKLVKEMMTSQKRTWKPAYPREVTSGDLTLDARFRFYCHHETAVQHIVALPEIKDLLLGFTEVDLVVHSDRVEFSDPSQKNIRAAMGGTMGMVASSAEGFARQMERAIPVHDRIAHLLAMIARRVTTTTSPSADLDDHHNRGRGSTTTHP